MISPQQLGIIAVMSVCAVLLKLAWDTRADWLYLLDRALEQYQYWLDTERERTAERESRRAAVKSQPLIAINIGDHSVKSSSVQESSQNATEAHSHATEGTWEESSEQLREALSESGSLAQMPSNLTCADVIELARAQVWTREELVALLAAINYLDGASNVVEYKKDVIAKFVGLRAATSAQIVDRIRGAERYVFVKSHPEREQYTRADIEQRS